MLSRKTFPIALAYVVTVHKSQGLMLDKVVLNISSTDFVSGLTYVAISGVEALQGLMFTTAFDHSRFGNEPSETVLKRRRDEQRRALQSL